MKAKHLVVGLLVLVLGMALTSCASRPAQKSGLVDTTCSNTNANAMIKNGDYQEKINNFLLIQDASSSMSKTWGKTFNYDSSKFEFSKELVKCLNNTLPNDFNANAGMRVFGPVSTKKGLIYGMSTYNKEALGGAVNSLGKTGGVSALANVIDNGNTDLSNMSGNAAVIILSDGVYTGGSNPVAAAAKMKEMYGDNVCIYTVLIGEDAKGKMTMEQIADAGKCGFATDLETIGQSQGMNKFVTDVFLAKVMRKPAPPAPVVIKKPAPVMEKPVEKISMTLHFEFDFDKAVVRPEAHDDATKIADSMKKYSKANVLLEGHTDSKGNEDYNMNLSKRRAESVKNYLVENFNVDASRISTAGYGKSNPVSTNDTPAGQQKNRRVVVIIE
jgi:OOP family OmpA-OmpF porin